LTALNLRISSYLPREQFKLFITTLYSYLASFPNFKSLTVSIVSFCSMNESSTPELHLLFPPSHKHLQQLEKLEIDLDVFNLNKSRLQYLSQWLKSVHCLKKLNINFQAFEFSPEAFISFFLDFKNLHSLRNLSLQFPYANLSNKSIQILFDSVNHLPLNNLSLHLGIKRETNFLTNLWKEKPKISPLSSALYGLSHLIRLDLNLSAFKLSTSEAKHFSLALKELKELCALSIALPEFDSDNKYEGLRSFLASFKAIPKLSSFTVSFNTREERIGDEEFRSLVENLQGCRCLMSLNVYFDVINQVTEDSIHSLAMGLKGLLLLKELQLRFTRREIFRNESICSLLESLTVLKHLESLSLRYSLRMFSPPVTP